MYSLACSRGLLALFILELNDYPSKCHELTKGNLSNTIPGVSAYPASPIEMLPRCTRLRCTELTTYSHMFLDLFFVETCKDTQVVTANYQSCHTSESTMMRAWWALAFHVELDVQSQCIGREIAHGTMQVWILYGISTDLPDRRRVKMVLVKPNS